MRQLLCWLGLHVWRGDDCWHCDVKLSDYDNGPCPMDCQGPCRCTGEARRSQGSRTD